MAGVGCWVLVVVRSVLILHQAPADLIARGAIMTPRDLADQPARYEKLKLIHHFLLLNIFDLYTTQTFIETNSWPY